MSNEKPELCEACSFETAELERYPYRIPKPGAARESHWLCWLCASTSAGNAHQYPALFPQRELMFHVCLVANLRGGAE